MSGPPLSRKDADSQAAAAWSTYSKQPVIAWSSLKSERHDAFDAAIFVQLNIAACGMSSDISSAGRKIVQSTSRSLEHVLFLRVESMLLTNQCRGEKG